MPKNLPDSGADAAPGKDVDLIQVGLTTIGVLVVSCFVMPFTLLRDTDTWSGSFLYWSASAAAVIAISALISSRWKD